MDQPVLTAALGAAIGLLMALTGAGGGVLGVPLLVFGLGLSVQQAAPVSLLAVCVSATLGALLGLREGIVRYRAAALMGCVALCLAPLGVWLAQRLPERPLLLAFAAVLTWTAWRMARTDASDLSPHAGSAPRAPCAVDPQAGRLRWTARCAWVLAGTGATSGLMTGLLGVGGGFVIVPALARYSDLDVRSIAATSLAVMALATASGIAAASGHGSLDLRLAATFGGAALVALLIGRRLARRLPETTLRRVFAGVSAVVAGLMLVRALGTI